MIGVVVGGGAQVWRSLETLEPMLLETGHRPRYYVVNDMIEIFPKLAVGCTLHPPKLETWIRNRSTNGLESLLEIWHHSGYRSTIEHARTLRDWGGSSGLFATQVALQVCDRVVLCGVPMTPDRHFRRGEKLWTDCRAFLPAWERHVSELTGKVRSLSGGYTEEKLGRATLEWMR